MSDAYRIDGPVRATADPRRAWSLASVLVATDWKVRFYGSALGYVWSLLRPLLMFAILYVVFSEIVGFGDDVVSYPIQLLAAMTMFFFFSEVTGSTLASLVERESLVRKIGFPRLVVPMAAVLLGVLNLLLNIVVLGLFIALQTVEPRWSWLLVPVPLALLAIGALGMGLLLSSLFVRFRDVRPIWEVILQASFYATPILWPVERAIEESQTLASVIMLNPLAVLTQSTRHLLLGPGVPSAAEAIGDPFLLLIPAAIYLVLVVSGVVLFRRVAPRAAEML